ncbi:MAG: protein kinase domain-containing protein [Planctomycetota bacterium]
MSDADSSRESSEPPEGSLIIQPGARLGGLKLVKELGLGGQGVVYHAVRESDGLEVAAKILRTDISLTDDLIERFEREAEAAGRLHHENIVAVHGIEEVGELRIILQELVTGGDLDDLIKERLESRDKTTLADCRWAADLCRRLALALAHAHDLKVVHRDMKPGNVLMTEEGVPKITDFGLAKVEDMFGLTQTGDRMGTPNYMSPEQVEAARGGVDSRTDIYSLGAMLYRMVTRRVPFAADDLTTLFRDILTRAPVPPRKLESAIPKDLQAVILRTLQKSPADRYQTAAEFAEDLQRFLDGKPTVARPEGFVVHTMRSMSHLTVSTLCVVAVLVPTAWFAIDLLVRQGTGTNISLHDVRYGWIGLCALVLVWPLSILGLRVTRGRAWTIAAAAGIAILLGGSAGYWVREQKTTQRHHVDRAVLAAAIDFEERGDRRDIDDLEAYVAAWEPRFDEDDFQILGRAYVKRLRPVQAERWVRRLEETRAGSPASLALVLAVADALSEDERAAKAEQSLWNLLETEADVGWRAWKQAGDVLRDVTRRTDAMRAYEAAGRQPDSETGRDQLNLQLAQGEIGLCNWEDAEFRLRTYIEWNETDPKANRVGCRIARKNQDWAKADEYLAVLEAGGPETRLAYLSERFEILRSRGRPEEAWQLVVDAAGRPDIDPAILDWCATKALFDVRDFEVARDLWELMAERRGDSAIPHIGLTMAYYRLGRAAESSDERLDFFHKSVEAGRHAIQLDPLFFQTYWNLFLPLYYTRVIERGGESELEPEDWQELEELVRQSLRYNGLQSETLNAGAFVLVRLYEKGGDDSHLTEAMQLVRSAIRLTERLAQGSCALSALDRGNLSDYYDTLRDLQERAGDLPGALATARTALDVLRDSDEDVEKRTEHVIRLEGLLSGGN